MELGHRLRLEVATPDQLRGESGDPDMKPEHLCEGSSLSEPHTPDRGAVGYTSQQLGTVSGVQWKGLHFILNLHLRGPWNQVQRLRQVIPTL